MLFLGALLGGLSSLGGSAISAKLALKEGRLNRRFQERMSNTAYQRSMADMRTAGLNPILAYKQGGASTPPGAMSKIPDLGAGVSNAIQAATSIAQIANVKASTSKLKSETQGIDADNQKRGFFGQVYDDVTSAYGQARGKAKQMKGWYDEGNKRPGGIGVKRTGSGNAFTYPPPSRKPKKKGRP